MEAIITPGRLERIFFQASRELKKNHHSRAVTEHAGLAVPTAAFLAFGTRPVRKSRLYKRILIDWNSFQGLFQVRICLPEVSLLFTKCQHGPTTIYEERNGPCHDLPYSNGPTGTGEQPEISPSKSHLRSTIRIWSLPVRKESPLKM